MISTSVKGVYLLSICIVATEAPMTHTIFAILALPTTIMMNAAFG